MEESGLYMLPETGKRADWETYRKITGKCETCGAVMTEHPICEGCKILCGMGHLEFLSRYWGHHICGHCMAAWKRLEKMMGRKVTWEECLYPTVKMLEGAKSE